METQHTLGHVDCPACEALRRFIVETSDWSEMTFNEAWPLWWEQKQQEIGEKTQKCYAEYRRTLGKFFGELKLKAIHIGHIIEYRKGRIPVAGPNLINHEINALGQLLERAGLWEPIKRRYKQLKVRRSTIGQRPSDEELVYLFEVAERKPRWRVAYLASVVSVQTTAGPYEVIQIRLGDLNWKEQQVRIPGTKTDDRDREVPMTRDCFMALRELELIARAKGATRPEHYLFPHRGNKEHPGADPTRPMNTYIKSWKRLCAEAAKRYPRLLHMRRKDLRHVSVSVILENPNVDEPTAKKIIGHGPYSRMAFDVYFHARQKRKKEAVSVLDGITRKKPVTPDQSEPSVPKEYIQ